MLLKAEGTEVYYELHGEKGPKVLLLHGWGCDSSLMRPVSERLQDEYRTLTIDFPGHGKSGRPPEPWGVPEYARCLASLLDQLDFSPCAVIAHSFGARVAAYLAAEDPSRFTKIVLTGAAGIRKPPTEEDKQRNADFQRKKQMAARLKAVPGLRGFAERTEEKLRQKYGSPDYRALDPEMRKTFVKVISQDLQEYYPKIQQSTLLIWGDRDTETPMWMGDKIESLIPDAGLVLLGGGTHFAYLERLNEFVLIVKNFLGPENRMF